MEAIPRLPMLQFELKNSPEATSFGKLKQFIGECYHEDPDTYSQEIYALETLRSSAMRPVLDISGCSVLKRYYAQLHSLQSRFPSITEREVLNFSWSDVHSNMISRSSDIKYEMAAILYNIGCIHTILGALDQRTTGDGMKLAFTHFQRSAWAFEHLREAFTGHMQGDMAQDMLIFMEQLSLAQAQECILEKSLADNRKAAIVAKVTSQIISYYNSALTALMTGGNEGRFAEFVENKTFKKWKRYVKFKVSYLSAILFLYQGQQSEEQQKMGERVTLYQAAFDKLEEARKESKGMMKIEQVNEALTFLGDVIEAKRKAAKNENEFIYHEEVPDISTISAVQGATLVKAIPFSVTDPEIMGEDIFHRIVPMKAHEASSLYSEEKAGFLRTIATKMEDKDVELKTFMSSLNIDPLMVDSSPRIPQDLVDRCAEINAKPNAIPDLIASMSNLADICVDVESMLNEISELLKEEEACEKSYQKTTGSRSSVNFGELIREFQKYQEAHQKAGESNETLRKAMGLHVTNLKILSKPLKELQASIPVIAIGETQDDDNFKQLNALLAKVQEMQSQRSQLYEQLREAAIKDDITAQIIAWGDKKLDKLFKQELTKHERNVALIEQNLTAQPNILRALTDTYAQCAPKIKNIVETKHKRDQFISSLIASFDVYEDLLGKSAKGLEFYKKLQGNIQKLLARVRASRDVQDEERQQRLKSVNVKPQQSQIPSMSMNHSIDINHTKSHTPKLKDYMKAGKLDPSSYLPPIRPSPLGSETTIASTVVEAPSYGGDLSKYNHHSMMSSYDQHQPPTYAASLNYPLANQSNYSGSGGGGHLPDISSASSTSSYINPGYTNPIYQTATQHPQYYEVTRPETQPIGGSSGTTHQPPPAYQLPYQMPPSYNDAPPAYTQQWDPNAVAAQINQMSIQQPNMSTTTVAGGYKNLDKQQPTPSSNVPTTVPASYPIDPQQNYYSSSYGNYQITANKQYVTGYDQTVYPAVNNQSVANTPVSSSANASNTQSFASHPGYSYNQNTGEYQYASGYQSDMNNGQQNPYYSQYTTAGGDNSYGMANTQTTVSGNQDTISGQSYAGHHEMTTYPQYNANDQMTPQISQAQQVVPPSVDSMAAGNLQYSGDGGYYYTPYGYQTTGAVPQSQDGYSTYSNYGQQSQNNQIPPLNQGVVMPTMNVEQSSIDQNQSQYSQQPMMQQQAQQQPTYYEYGMVSSSAVHQQLVNNPMTYMNSNSNGGTITTSSNNYGNSTTTSSSEVPPATAQVISNPPQQPQQPTVVQPKPQVVQQSTPSSSKPKNSNIDLLLGIDFTSLSPLPDTLQPDIVGSDSDKKSNILEPILAPQKNLVSETNTSIPKQQQPSSSVIIDNSVVDRVRDFVLNERPSPQHMSSVDRKSSVDNLSICSDLSSLDQNFDWDSTSAKNDEVTINTLNKINQLTSGTRTDPFDDVKIVKYFHKEVERFEKFMESLNVKTLNGTTAIDGKWKEIQDLLVKDESKRTANVAKLFPEKNRSVDCIPYDHSRVLLPTTTDDYINAAYVRELGPECPQLILAQTPMQNTVEDFWSMIWSQKSCIIVCLHTSNELLDPYWPQELNKECTYGDYSITLLQQFDLSHCVERSVKVTMHGSDAILNLSIIQNKNWIKNSTGNMLGIANNVITVYRQKIQELKNTTIVTINCLTGTERSAMVSCAITTILATQTKRPILINVVDFWFRICSQRKGALRDIAALHLSLEIVLTHAHELLNKRGIMTSYQMKTAQTVKAIEKEEIKDPFSDLDPLWKLKGMK